MIDFKTYIKGFLMGTCDLIPGISGGTIAFITGIYPKIISSIESFSFTLVSDSAKYIYSKDKSHLAKIKKDIKKMNLIFLLTLGAGMLSAILLLSGVISYLLENRFTYTTSFFSGLILASSVIIFKHIKDHRLSNISFAFIGMLCVIPLVFLRPSIISDPSYFYVFLGGFFGISAMFLPGISGAFILLIMGLYGPILESIHAIKDNFTMLLVFGMGLVSGAFIISRAISFLFRKNKCRTLYFLLGLVVGSLIIPLKQIKESTILDISSLNIIIMFFLLGILIVLFINNLGERKKEELISTG